MQERHRIARLIEPTVEDMGFRLVRVHMTGSVRQVLQVMAEPLDGSGMTVEHCADLSRALSAVLDVEDPISDAYTLEVSSPGVDRPLTRREDFERYAGFDARVEMDAAVEGRRRYKGRLHGLDDDGRIVIADEGETVRLDFAEVRRAKLLLTDALLAAHAQGQLGGGKAAANGKEG